MNPHTWGGYASGVFGLIGAVLLWLSWQARDRDRRDRKEWDARRRARETLQRWRRGGVDNDSDRL